MRDSCHINELLLTATGKHTLIMLFSKNHVFNGTFDIYYSFTVIKTNEREQCKAVFDILKQQTLWYGLLQKS